MRTRTRDQCCFEGCPGTGTHITYCGSCSNFFHYACLGWEDIVRDVTGVAYSCDECLRRQAAEKEELQRLRLQMEQFSLNFANLCPTRPVVLPEFSGLDHEDPVAFLRICHSSLDEAKVPSSQWVSLIQSQLKGAAKSWQRTYGDLPLSWGDFKDRLLLKFDGPAVRASLQASFYGQPQREADNVEIFLTQKVQMYRRLCPDSEPSNIIPLLIELLKPALRPFLRCPPPSSINDLILRATAVETDLRAAKSSITSRPRPTPPPQPPKCRHCPGWHYHRECPVLQQENMRSTGQGNWRTAGTSASRPAETNAQQEA